MPFMLIRSTRGIVATVFACLSWDAATDDTLGVPGRGPMHAHTLACNDKGRDTRIKLQHACRLPRRKASVASIGAA
jgi:hypothetical protein